MKKKKKLINNKEIIIYTGKVEVTVEKDTVWLMQKQIAELFDTERSVVTKHLRNIFGKGELQEKSNVQKMHIAESDKPVKFYNLDVIISVGYRVNSERATQFRIWATNILRDHLIKGVTVNQNRIQELKGKQLKEFERALSLIEAARSKALSYDEAAGLLEIITHYANTWLLLQKYDQGNLEIDQVSKKSGRIIDYAEARNAIAELKKDLIGKKEASDIFGQERGETLEGILVSIGQSFGGKELYPSIEEKAAHLLYFIIKDHPFVDGNKRIAALLFILFLSKNNYHLDKKGQLKINPNALVALALLIAESRPKQKDIMIKLIINFLNK
ncbi:MAG: filamentation induced by camp protein fic [Parcubacteria group bacterium LiPW_39]|nr:MAG: filamentation induced by camp protein fic [Parcubacteria group bacterium LiPW_39]